MRTLKLLYYAYVRPKLQYDGIAWFSSYGCHRTAIETVQRKLLKFLAVKMYGTYPESGTSNQKLCNKVNMVSLPLRKDCSSKVFYTNF